MNPDTPLTDDEYSQLTQLFMRETVRRFSGMAVQQIMQTFMSATAPVAPQTMVPVSAPEPSPAPLAVAPIPEPQFQGSARPRLKSDQKEEIKKEIINVIKQQPTISTQNVEFDIMRKFRDIGQFQINGLIRELRHAEKIMADNSRPLRWTVVDDEAALSP